MVRGKMGVSGVLSMDSGWAGRGAKGATDGGAERSEGDGARDSSSTIEYGRLGAVQLASSGFTPNRAEGLRACDSTAVSAIVTVALG